MYTEGAGPVCKCTGQCTVEASFPTANLFTANFPRTQCPHSLFVVVLLVRQLQQLSLFRCSTGNCKLFFEIFVINLKTL